LLCERVELDHVVYGRLESGRVGRPQPLDHDLQAGLHLLESSFSLVEEAVDDAAGKFALVFVVVHLEDLLERLSVDAVSAVW